MKMVYSPRKRRLRATGFFAAGVSLALVLGSIWSMFSLLRDLPRPERITERTVAESTKIFDRTGTVLLYEVHGEEKRTIIALAEIPRHVKLATLAAEDLYFYTHRGLDWRGIIRAAAKNVLRGDITQGGSTITQQLIKNSLLGSARAEAGILQSLQRKFKEQVLAILTERKYSKDEILELYLNQIPYGSSAYGIAAAAETFFDKKPEALTLAEAAVLAALPKAPTYYSPYGSHKDELMQRKDWILDRMGEAEFAAREEIANAKKSTLTFIQPTQNIRAPHFVFYLREYLNEKYGESFVEQGGLKVVSTLDWKLQEEAEQAIREGAEKNERAVEASNAALVALNPKSGEILAMVGSRDYWGGPEPDGCTPGHNCRFDPHVNVALRPRQPGSAFKPFVYATAFKKGYSPETVLFDVPTEFNPLCNPDGTRGPQLDISRHRNVECYHPKNYDGRFRGPVSLRQALAQSLNVPSVKLLYLAGVADSLDTAETFGITTLKERERFGLSLVLGGAEVTLLEMVSAFGAFSQDGTLIPKTGILRVENARGGILEEKKSAPRDIIDREIARTINDVLSDNDARVPVFSPRSALYFPDREVAAKTGTTQDFRDAWVVGYTPSLVVGVWAGNSDNTPMNKTALSVMVAVPLWHQFLENALKGTPAESFIKPEPRTAEKPVFRGIYRTGEIIQIDKVSKKRATPYTPPELIEEVSFGEIQSILAYLDRDDPRGPPPAIPAQNPQLKNWQAGINAWLSEHPLEHQEPPKEFDDLHAPEKHPAITFLVPDENATTTESVREISVRVTSAFPLSEVSLFLNDALGGSKTAPIPNGLLSFRFGEPLLPGVYTLKITAYDAVGNKESKEREIVVLR